METEDVFTKIEINNKLSVDFVQNARTAKKSCDL